MQQVQPPNTSSPIVVGHDDEESLKSKIYDYLPRWRTMENKNNECLDYLSIERSQLAWLLTTVSVLSMGIAVSTLVTKDTTESFKILFTSIGITFLAFALFLVVYSFVRYWFATRKLMEGVFVGDRMSPLFISIFGVCICILALVVILVKV